MCDVMEESRRKELRVMQSNPEESQTTNQMLQPMSYQSRGERSTSGVQNYWELDEAANEYALTEQEEESLKKYVGEEPERVEKKSRLSMHFLKKRDKQAWQQQKDKEKALKEYHDPKNVAFRQEKPIAARRLFRFRRPIQGEEKIEPKVDQMDQWINKINSDTKRAELLGEELAAAAFAWQRYELLDNSKVLDPIVRYTMDMYTPMNEYLRNRESWQGDSVPKQYADLLSKSMQRACLPRDMVLTRRFGFDALAGMGFAGAQNLRSFQGVPADTVFEEKAFCSTGYCNNDFTGDVEMCILAHKGDHGVCFEKFSAHSDEKEVALAPGQKFRVIESKK